MTSTAMPAALGAAPAAVALPALDFLAAELAAHAGRPEVLALVVPAPLAPPEALLRAAERSHAVLWDPPQGDAAAGVGAAWRLDLAGPGRFLDLRRAADRLWSRLRLATHPGAPPRAPRLYGGFAFDVGAASGAPWEEFGDGCFTLPRFTYVSGGPGAGQAGGGAIATLTLAVGGDEVASAASRRRWCDEAAALLAALADDRGADREPAPGAAEPLAIERLPLAEWSRRVEAIRAAIATGEVEKIVAARRSVVELAAPLRSSEVLGRLSRGLRSSTRFAFCRERSTFLGATPERLVSLRGRRLRTEALAGTIRTGSDHARELLASVKDREEHRLVVDSIVRRLEPLCAELEVTSPPQIRELRDVLHLLTPIAGRLQAPRHVLDLVEVLHPTPAVGGVPTEAARRWIATAEPEGRGWYAAPIGWFDAAGDGDFAVALRSSVLCGERAYLWAGAGIVRDSDPRLEHEETALKEQALLASLGAG